MAITTFALNWVPNHPAYYTCFLAVLSGLYATTLMAALNNRINFSVKSHSTTWKDNAHSAIDFPMRPIGQQATATKGDGSTVSGSGRRTVGVIVMVTRQEDVLDDEQNYRGEQVRNTLFRAENLRFNRIWTIRNASTSS